MKKLTIVAWHFLVFIAGSFGLIVYFAQKISALPGKAALAGIALIPVAVVFIAGFGILCLLSLLLWLLAMYLRGLSAKKGAHHTLEDADKTSTLLS